MAGDGSLIDQELAARAAGPPLSGREMETTPERALVWLVYRAVVEKRRGLPGCDDAKIERSVRTAWRRTR
jgi:hypothetical protein